MTYPIPDAALAHHTILLGKTRAGKSSVMRGMVERLLDQGKPVCIIDPKGDWWGLKSSADGKRAGYSVIIFGGEHADVPLNAHSGAHVAELVATGNRPCIIDLGGWFVGERTRFFIDFASTLFRHTRGPRYLAIDEVHNFAPQGKIHDPDAGKMLHWANRLASEGAGKGITLISASQRPQKVHKDHLTSHETLIAMRVIHKLDRDAIKDWIDGCPDPALGREVLVTLASMARGEGWVWSPEAGFGPVRIQFPMFSTYDSFAAPTSETVEKLKGWASVDLDDVRSKLAAVVEEAKANDPKLLKAEVARLTRELAVAQRAAQPDPKKAASAQPAWPDQREEVAKLRGQVALLSKAIEDFNDRMGGIWERWKAPVNDIMDAQNRLFGTMSEARLRPIGRPDSPLDMTIFDMVDRPAPPTRREPRRTPDPPSPAPPRAARSELGVTARRDGTLSKAQQRVLDALAWWAGFGIERPRREQVAFIAGYSPTSGGFFNLLGGLRSAGLLDYPAGGEVSLTDAGRAAATIPDVELTQSAFHAQVRGKLSPAQVRVLDPVLAAYPNEISSNDLAEAAGYSPTSGGFFNLRGSLRTLGLLDYPTGGQVRASDWLFP